MESSDGALWLLENGRDTTSVMARSGSTAHQKSGTVVDDLQIVAIDYRIIQKHGGRIDVESVVGKGSTFFIRIPLSVQERI